MKRIFLVFALGVALILPSGASAQSPPPLIVEAFDGPTPETSGQCDIAQPSTFTYSSQGVAAGTYPGTYSEAGSFTLAPSSGPNPFLNRTVTAFSASFTILSGDTVITGTKTLTSRTGVQNVGSCNPGPPTSVGIVQTLCTYEAIIQSPLGDFIDRGQCGVGLVDNAVFGPGFFEEDFNSDLTEVIPLTTPGHSTGGGKIAPNVTFGFNAKSDNKGIKGTCNVVDHIADVHVRCLDVRSYAQTTTHATFSGSADVNGTLTTYRIDVDDNGEPGTADTFRIVTGAGYTAGGVLTAGNVQVHS